MTISGNRRLFDLLQLNEPTRVVDIGANPIGNPAPYQSLLGEGLCRVTGLEPDESALALLNAVKSPLETYLPLAAGDGTRKTLHLCRHSGWTSTLAPDPRALAIFSAYQHNATVLRRIEIDTHRLDDIEGLGRIDLLKIDIQGGELAVFENARQALAEAVLVQTEVSFFPTYDGQPSFGEIDICLRRQGFLPHCIPDGIKGGIIAPMMIADDPWHTLNQVLDADIVYVRDLRHSEDIDHDQLRRLALLAHACYGSFDLAMHCIRLLEERNALPAGSLANYGAMATEALNQQ